MDIMEILNKINQTRCYLDYIENHINNILKAWNIIQDKCKDMDFMKDAIFILKLNDEIVNHDISKLSEHEFVQYRKNFFPTDLEKELKELFDDQHAVKCEKEFNNAWEHHLKNNMHHWQSWTKTCQYNDNDWKIHCVHMICDWMAMSYQFNDTAESFYEKNKHNMNIPDYAESFIYEIFIRIK
jgi:hypothetical protein